MDSQRPLTKNERRRQRRNAAKQRQREEELAGKVQEPVESQSAAPVDKAVELIIDKDPEGHWADVERPPTLSDISLELRALREGWLKDAPDSRALALSTFISVMNKTDSDSLKLRALNGIVGLIKHTDDLATKEAVLRAKSIELGENQYEDKPVVVEQAKDDGKIEKASKEAVLRQMLEHEEDPRVLEILLSVAAKAGIKEEEDGDGESEVPS